jgi:hypothetical protein
LEIGALFWDEGLVLHLERRKQVEMIESYSAVSLAFAGTERNSQKP